MVLDAVTAPAPLYWFTLGEAAMILLQIKAKNQGEAAQVCVETTPMDRRKLI
jgi:hypothetical protein